MNNYDFKKTGIEAKKVGGYSRRYLLTSDHLGSATATLGEAVKVMEAIDLEKVDLKSVYNFAEKVSTAANRIKRIQLHETLIDQMAEFLLENMTHNEWYTKENIKIFLGSNWRNSIYYQQGTSYKEPLHHIDVLLERLTLNGTLKSIAKNGNTYYSSVASDF